MTRPVALVTGAGRRNGIAYAVSLALAGDGWDVAFTYWRDYERRMSLGGDPDADPVALAREIEATGVRALAVEADLADARAPERVLAEVSGVLGPVGALVLSHSESVDSGILDTSIESFDRHFAVNARAAWLLIRAVAQQLPESGGRVVALTSDHVVDNMPYGASKGALDRIVIAAAGELAHLGLTANIVNPGPVDTGWMDDATRATLVERQPTGRLGTPEDVARLVRFLVSPDARWVTGQLITSDGGFSI